MKAPGPDHPIAILPNPKRVVVTMNGQTLADTRASLTLTETTMPPVHYIPRADVDMSRLQRTERVTHCPYKGDCAYYSIPEGGERSENAVWSYEDPYPSVIEIKDHLAFYPNRVDSIQEI
jgi:uncharacterized protein (DUF427 family)